MTSGSGGGGGCQPPPPPPRRCCVPQQNSEPPAAKPRAPRDGHREDRGGGAWLAFRPPGFTLGNRRRRVLRPRAAPDASRQTEGGGRKGLIGVPWAARPRPPWALPQPPDHCIAHARAPPPSCATSPDHPRSPTRSTRSESTGQHRSQTAGPSCGPAACAARVRDTQKEKPSNGRHRPASGTRAASTGGVGTCTPSRRGGGGGGAVLGARRRARGDRIARARVTWDGGGTGR